MYIILKICMEVHNSTKFVTHVDFESEIGEKTPTCELLIYGPTSLFIRPFSQNGFNWAWFPV